MHLRNHVKCQTGTPPLSNRSSIKNVNSNRITPKSVIPNIELPLNPSPTKSSPKPNSVTIPILKQSHFGTLSRTHSRTPSQTHPRRGWLSPLPFWLSSPKGICCRRYLSFCCHFGAERRNLLLLLQLPFWLLRKVVCPWAGNRKSS